MEYHIFIRNTSRSGRLVVCVDVLNNLYFELEDYYNCECIQFSFLFGVIKFLPLVQLPQVISSFFARYFAPSPGSTPRPSRSLVGNTPSQTGRAVQVTFCRTQLISVCNGHWSQNQDIIWLESCGAFLTQLFVYGIEKFPIYYMMKRVDNSNIFQSITVLNILLIISFISNMNDVSITYI